MYVWTWKRFDELSLGELYEILKVRQQVFTVEQNCVYQDVDGLDNVSWHLFARLADAKDGAIQAYLRVVEPGYKYQEPSIGRVMTVAAARGTGAGKMLMANAMTHIAVEFPGARVRISAQLYLKVFYEGFGFQAVSEPYAEDDIPHIEMVTGF
jgi:ElaA protein